MVKRYISPILLLAFTLSFYNIPNYTQEELTPDRIFEKTDNSVVVVLAYDNQGNMFQGSGVVIEKGIIVTNHHVIKGAGRIEIKHYSKEIKQVTIFKYDEAKDILLLKVTDNTLVPIQAGNSNALKTGQRVYTIGSPEGYENSISEGIISGFRTGELGEKLIQMTAPITEGSSGGAVVNSRGELIGLSTSGQHEGNLYFCIPVNDVLELLGADKKFTDAVDPAEYYKIGEEASENKNYKDAEVYFTKYLEKFSNDVSAYYNRGYARFKLKEYKKAISDFSRVLENASTSEPYFYRANCFYSLKDYHNAYSDYTKALELEPDNPDIYYNRGYSLFRIKEYERAITDWKKAIELNPVYQSELDAKIKIAAENIN